MAFAHLQMGSKLPGWPEASPELDVGCASHALWFVGSSSVHRAIILFAGENGIANGQRLHLTAQYLPRARRKPFCCGGVDAGRGA